jgi:hypothetical protein
VRSENAHRSRLDEQTEGRLGKKFLKTDLNILFLQDKPASMSKTLPRNRDKPKAKSETGGASITFGAYLLRVSYPILPALL